MDNVYVLETLHGYAPRTVHTPVVCVTKSLRVLWCQIHATLKVWFEAAREHLLRCYLALPDTYLLETSARLTGYRN